jgi:hypothetical protein
MNKPIKSVSSRPCFLGFLALSMLFVFMAGCALPGAEWQSRRTGKQDGLPVKKIGGQLERGLSVVYFHDKYRHSDDMPESEAGVAKFGRPGAPIVKLDHQFGKGEVFNSGRNEEIGVLMDGFIRLDKPGKYSFQAKSNDGFQLFIDGNLIVSDPGVHGDRLSDIGYFEVVQAGMFPVRIKYFQRKGTAMLGLYWQPPGESSFSVVPGEAYSHVQK